MKEQLKQIKEELEKLSESVASFSRNKLLEQAKFAGQKAINWGKRVALELTLASILSKKEFVNSSVQAIQKAIQESTNQLNKLVSDIHAKNKKLEELKNNIVLVKKYEGLFLNSLCNLHTVEKSECGKSSIK
ncbi:hypothetical protein OVS_03140 [Mycoplasma ovis str. Michigan]|uniref:Uncharacterized protein n=1 Tax=Mycoplasma ovis str. Michigan TaxID=1415773 RepID=A0ABM5P1S9_9MOLU|nr:hypothetical protein [Mycoplasma ovis]AHC40382.1 hypothetical protein OVS_03140 [Mycoplasma ovis str. Michigan]